MTMEELPKIFQVGPDKAGFDNNTEKICIYYTYTCCCPTLDLSARI